MKGLRQKKRPKIVDVIISLCIIGVLFGVVIARYQRMYHDAREAALRSELLNMRLSIKLFRTLKGRNPESLSELVETKALLPARTGQDNFTASIFQEKYLVPHAVDGEGNILDAFGNTFRYDPLSGTVTATTKGYEDW